MDSIVGQTISHYRVVSRVSDRAAVYKAEDEQSGLRVQLKFLPESFREHEKAFREFQQVSQAIATLNHPHIAAVFDLDEWESRPFLVTEPVEGEMLGPYVAQRPVRFTDLLDLCEQVAEALEEAHAAGVVHGGLGTENVVVSRRGAVKVTEFGLAALAAAVGDGRDAPAVFVPSPEQLRGKTADARSDLFALGAILYETATDKKPFSGTDAAAVRQAILENDPPPPTQLNPDLPARFDEIVAKAMEKDPDLRYQSAAELRTDLRRLRRDWESERVAAARAALAESAAEASAGGSVAGQTGGRSPNSKRSIAWIIAAVVLLAGAGGAVATRLLHRSRPAMPMILHSLAFGRGWVASARFGPGGTIFYTAQRGNDPPQIFSVHAGSSHAVPLGMKDAEILSVSPSKELAILSGIHVSAEGRAVGNLENMALIGSQAEPLLANVEAADWSTAGRSIAVVRRVAGKDRLEYPIGKVLAATMGWFGDPRFSPQGDQIAFVEHPQLGEDAGSVNVVDLEGHERKLTGSWEDVSGLAWAPQGKEIWFTASRRGPRKLYAVDLAGKTRQVRTTTGSLRLCDIAADGHVLLSRDDSRAEIGEFVRGQKSATGLSSLTGYLLRDVSADGKTLLLEQATSEGNGIFVEQLGDPKARQVGTGRALALSPDGKRVLAVTAGADGHLVVLPVGAGKPVNLPLVDVSHRWAAWLPGGKQFVFLGRERGQGLRLFVEDVAGGPPRSISPAGLGASAALSPDGRRVAAMGPDGKGYLYPVRGGAVPAFRGLSAGDRLVGWYRYGRDLYVAEGAMPVKIFRLSLVSGAKRLLWQIAPSDQAGVTRLGTIRVTPNGRLCFFSYRRTLSHLYLAEGVR